MSNGTDGMSQLVMLISCDFNYFEEKDINTHDISILHKFV